ncbi:MAG: hypothetical protein Q9195_003747 [Heterodermia aff. obscurata]
MKPVSPLLVLTEVESQIRQLLLDTSDHIATLNGYQRPELRFAGGWVRDKLLGLPSDDIDVCIDNLTGYKFVILMQDFVNATYDAEKAKNILGTLAKVDANPDKSKHLETTIMRVFRLHLDFVNLRKEVYDENSRTPTMTFGTAEEDALRRDSTINSLFFNITSSEVEDFTGRGLQDLEHKIIKTPLAPYETFRDDPLRVLRHIRFASKLGFTIASVDEQAMGDPDIQAALKLKISRERIGVEIEKMLKAKLGHVLLRAEDRYHAWLLFALVPWAKVTSHNARHPKGKRLATAAAIVARDGIKAPNKAPNNIIDIVEHASRFVLEVQAMVKGPTNYNHVEEDSNREKQGHSSLRLVYGKAIRSWGAHWRLCVFYAFFVQIYGTDSSSWQSVFESYTSWLSRIESLRLLEVYSLKPLANGTDLQKALGASPGKWTKIATDMVIEWQLLNPAESDPEKAIAEVQRRKGELDLTK